MSDVVIRVEHLSKSYQYGVINHGTFSKDLQSWWAHIRGKEDPNAVLSQSQCSGRSGQRFWALQDVTFDVEQGEVVGIIGRNGAGKSTLLKILSEITTPSKGRVKLRGRVGSLLEVGTGFHPELTGKENIFLNGAILGMTKAEIRKKLDEIITFAEIEAFINTPVKRYSSGMYVRLAFAVAAHLEPEILLVDEVLAVGDAAFQKKCLGKIGNVAQEGRTVLFISHNMQAVKSLCTQGIILENGCVKFHGEIHDCVNTYVTDMSARGTLNNFWEFDQAPGTHKIKIKSAYVKYQGDRITVNTPFDIITEFWNLEEGFSVNVSMILYDMPGNVIFNISTKNVPLAKGLHQAVFHIPAHFMNDGYYTVYNMFVNNARAHFLHEHALSFEILEDRNGAWHGKWVGAVRPTFIQNEYRLLSQDIIR